MGQQNVAEILTVGAISGLVTPCIFELRRQSSSVHSALSWLSTKLQVVQQSLSKKRKNGSDVNITLHLYSCCKPPCLGLCQLFPGLFLGVQDCSLQRKVPNVMFEVSNIFLHQYQYQWNHRRGLLSQAAC